MKKIKKSFGIIVICTAILIMFISVFHFNMVEDKKNVVEPSIEDNYINYEYYNLHPRNTYRGRGG